MYIRVVREVGYCARVQGCTSAGTDVVPGSQSDFAAAVAAAAAAAAAEVAIC